MKEMTILHRMGEGGKCLIGMVHCLPLPGTLGHGGDMEKIYEKALTDARTLEAAGFGAVIVENTTDMPYARNLSAGQLAALAAITRCVVQAVRIPVGVDASFSDTPAALAAAYAAGAQFVRSPAFVDTVQVTGLGSIGPCAQEVLHMRRQLGAEDIAVFADVQVKHSHMVNPSVSLEESVQAAADCGADALIVTGLSTGLETPMETVSRAKEASKLPVIIGSGFAPEIAAQQLAVADGAIVGSALKQGGVITAPVDAGLCRLVVQAVRGRDVEEEGATL